MNVKKIEKTSHCSKYCLVVFLFIQYTAFGQIKAPRFYSEHNIARQRDSLLIGQSNKTIPPKYETAILTALMHYPELHETKIVFKRKKLKSTMAARPKGLQILRRKTKRKYVVLYNDFHSAEIPADSIPFNALVGVFGHELAHIQEYEQKSSFAIIKIGLNYSNKNFKTTFERATDQRTINHGLLWQCYDFAMFAFHYKQASSEYLEHKKRTYMHPEEIEAQSKSSHYK